MKNLGVILSIVSLLGCGVLFAQNRTLQAELETLNTKVEALSTQSKTADTKKPMMSMGMNPKISDQVERRSKRSERSQTRRSQTPSRTEEITTRAETEKPGGKASAESIQAKYELVTERVSEGVDAYADEAGLSSADHEAIKTIVLDNLAEQHALRLAIQSGERDKSEGRDLFIALRTAQEEALLEVLDQDSYDALMVAIRSSRLPSRGGR